MVQEFGALIVIGCGASDFTRQPGGLEEKNNLGWPKTSFRGGHRKSQRNSWRIREKRRCCSEVVRWPSLFSVATKVQHLDYAVTLCELRLADGAETYAVLWERTITFARLDISWSVCVYMRVKQPKCGLQSMVLTRSHKSSFVSSCHTYSLTLTRYQPFPRPTFPLSPPAPGTIPLGALKRKECATVPLASTQSLTQGLPGWMTHTKLCACYTCSSV